MTDWFLLFDTLFPALSVVDSYCMYYSSTWIGDWGLGIGYWTLSQRACRIDESRVKLSTLGTCHHYSR